MHFNHDKSVNFKLFSTMMDNLNAILAISDIQFPKFCTNVLDKLSAILAILDMRSLKFFSNDGVRYNLRNYKCRPNLQCRLFVRSGYEFTLCIVYCVGVTQWYYLRWRFQQQVEVQFSRCGSKGCCTLWRGYGQMVQCSVCFHLTNSHIYPIFSLKIPIFTSYFTCLNSHISHILVEYVIGMPVIDIFSILSHYILLETAYK